MSENVTLLPSYLIVGLVEYRFLGRGSFTPRISKILLHYFPTSRNLTKKPDTVLIPSPVAIQLGCSLWKLLGFVTGVLEVRIICLGASLFSFVVLGTW